MESTASQILVFLLADPRASRERMRLLEQTLLTLRPELTTMVFSSQTPMDSFIQKVRQHHPSLVLIPNHLLNERMAALTSAFRHRSPVAVGYWTESTRPEVPSASAPTASDRFISLNAAHLDKTNLAKAFRNTLRAIALPQLRSGLSPLYLSKQILFEMRERWDSNRSLGGTLDAWERWEIFQELKWRPFLPRIRQALLGLWQWAMDQGSGEALVQVTADAHAFWIRVIAKRPQWNIAHAVQHLQDSQQPDPLYQGLLHAAQWLRIQSIGNAGISDLTLGCFLGESTAPSLWISSLPESLWAQEKMPQPSSYENPESTDLLAQPGSRAHERLLKEAKQQIHQLQESLRSKEASLAELRSGGVGTAAPIPPPDAEGLIEAFQWRLEDLKVEIEKVETAMAELPEDDSRALQMEALQKTMEGLKAKQRQWIRNIYEAIKAMSQRKAG